MRGSQNNGPLQQSIPDSPSPIRTGVFPLLQTVIYSADKRKGPEVRPISEFPAEAREKIEVLLTDIDDTITTDGLLPSTSLAALERLYDSGIIVIPVTGRPAGWCDHIARMWPVHAVVGENGALHFSYDRKQKKMRTFYAKSAEERMADQKQLRALWKTIEAEVPGVGIASDQDYRVADLAIDFCEDVPPLPKASVQRIVEILESAGATTKVSSIHINAWFGGYDKLTTTRQCLHDLFGMDMDAANERIVFAGDSPNDVPMFARFKNSIGVANVANFELIHEPTWVTTQEGAAGFTEIAEAILAAKEGRECMPVRQN